MPFRVNKRKTLGYMGALGIGMGTGVGATTALSECPADAAEVARLEAIETAARNFDAGAIDADTFRATLSANQPPTE